jgi:hypothetical protein
MEIKNQTINGGKQQFSDKIENYGGDKNLTNKSISVGNNVTVGNGSFVTGKIENSFNSSQADNEINQLLTDLLKHISELNNKIPAEKAQVLEDISQDAELLVAETQREEPRKNRLGISLDGIKEAALALKEMGEPILEIATKLSSILLGI